MAAKITKTTTKIHEKSVMKSLHNKTRPWRQQRVSRHLKRIEIYKIFEVILALGDALVTRGISGGK